MQSSKNKNMKYKLIETLAMLAMKRPRQGKMQIRPGLLAGLAGAMFLALTPTLESQEAKTNSAVSAVQPPAGSGNKQDATLAKNASNDAAVKKAKPVKKELSGAEIYSMHCARCHPERYPTERTAAQWKTIVLHMRVRANLPAEQARGILKYLQDNSGR